MKRLLAFCLFSALAFAQHQVSLAWNWAQGTGDPATSFNIYRATTAGGPYTNVGTIASASFTFADTSAQLTAGTTFFYVVTAVGPGGESGYSNEVAMKIPSAAPSAPTSLTGSAR